MTVHPRPGFDITRPHPARVRNHWLGGNDNFPADRVHGDTISAVFPEILDSVRASKGFLRRAVTHLTAEAGVRQFLDVGPGLPLEHSTHAIAQRIAPESHVVYVDNDPHVLVHARALLVSAPEGSTAYLEADVRDPKLILELAAETLDFTEPVALVLTAVMGLIQDLEEAYTITRTLLDDLPSGSYLVLHDGAADPDNEQIKKMHALSAGYEYRYRTPQEVAAFFDGLELLEPGMVSPAHWRNDPEPDGPFAPFESCGVGRKPRAPQGNSSSLRRVGSKPAGLWPTGSRRRPSRLPAPAHRQIHPPRRSGAAPAI